MRIAFALRGCTIALALPMTIAVPARAQTVARPPAAVAPGAKVRVKLRSGDRREGRLVALGRDTLTVAWRGDTTESLLVATVARLDVSNGQHRPVLRGALLGTAAGVSIGAIAGALSYSPCTSTETLGCYLSPGSRTESAGFGGLVGGVLGLVVGAGQGLVPRDRWERVPLDGAAMRVGVRALPGGVGGVALAIAF